MKASEALKSRFVYPDKLYARTNNNITIDISYAPQTLEAVEYTRTDAFVEKAADWLNNFYNEDTHSYLIDENIEKFINYMKGE